jgi:hypothetical protein
VLKKGMTNMIVRMSARAMWGAGLVAAMAMGPVGMAHDPGCAAPTFAYGNAGFASGYSRWVHGFAAPMASCPTPRPACGPCWRPCLPRSCGPSIGGWPCRPSWDWGCFGVARYAGHDSVFLSVSPGGSATFFSGCLVPCVVPWYPSTCAAMPRLSAVTHQPTPVIAGTLLGGAVPRLALIDREPPARMSNADARRRAGKLVEAGDHHLRGAVGERRKLAAALSAYRRAATVAPDLPEPLIRQAIVLVALDRQADVAEAIGAVAAIDPRLAGTVADRGTRALREIWHDEAPAGDGPPGPAANWIADRWSGQWHPEATRLAAAAASPR